MSKRLEQVKEFMLTFGQNVADKPTILDEDTQKLRIALIFEELKEYAEASGQLDYFIGLCSDESEQFNESLLDNNYIPLINQVEQFDALLDLEYVLLGAVHSHGFGEIFDTGFDEVQNSNMSKADDDVHNALLTQYKYQNEGTSSVFKENYDTGKYTTYRLSDKKVLKSHKYKPAQLAQFLK